MYGTGNGFIREREVVVVVWKQLGLLYSYGTEEASTNTAVTARAASRNSRIDEDKSVQNLSPYGPSFLRSICPFYFFFSCQCPWVSQPFVLSSPQCPNLINPVYSIGRSSAHLPSGVHSHPGLRRGTNRVR